MKKKVLLLVLVVSLVLSVCACGNKDVEKVENNNEIVEVDNNDYMTKHIKSISPENRNEFLSFWHAAISYCKTIGLELKGMNNQASYEFDPTDESQIPEAIKGIYDFSRLNQKNTKGLHKDFKMEIDGVDVKLSFDGIDIYPTEYEYSEIQGIIDSLK